MSKEKTSIKKDVGVRFSRFRKQINKTQQQLADELGIYQSTITSFEKGKTFPNLKYLFHVHEKYGLDITWLITGKGDMLVGDYRISSNNAGQTHEERLRYYAGDKKSRAELQCLMDIPIIEQVIMAKFLELKTLLKDEIDEFYRMTGLREKKGNGNGDEA